MTTEQSRMIIAVEEAKMFLLHTCPIQELPTEYVQDVVFSYRSKHIKLEDALNHFIRVEQDLVNMVQFNWFLNDIISKEVV